MAELDFIDEDNNYKGKRKNHLSITNGKAKFVFHPLSDITLIMQLLRDNLTVSIHVSRCSL